MENILVLHDDKDKKLAEVRGVSVREKKQHFFTHVNIKFDINFSWHISSLRAAPLTLLINPWLSVKPTRDRRFQMKHLYFSLCTFVLPDLGVLALTRSLITPKSFQGSPYWSHFLSLERAHGWPLVTLIPPYKCAWALSHIHMRALFNDSTPTDRCSVVSNSYNISVACCNKYISLESNARENIIIFNGLWYTEPSLRVAWDKTESQFWDLMWMAWKWSFYHFSHSLFP